MEYDEEYAVTARFKEDDPGTQPARWTFETLPEAQNLFDRLAEDTKVKRVRLQRVATVTLASSSRA